MDHYNIALDNPVTILHQEQAKTFFSQKDTEKNLWEFVMSSTQMKSIQDEYRDSKTQLELAHSQLQEKRRHLSESKQELKDLSKKEDAFEKFRLKNKNKDFNEMIKWGWANDLKKKDDDIRRHREKKSAEVERLQNNLEGWKGSFDDLIKKRKHFELTNNQVKDNATLKQDSIQKLKSDLRVLMDKKMQLDSMYKEIITKQG